MKKTFKFISCIMVALLLTGCGNSPTPNNGDDNVVSLKNGDLNITVNDLYQKLKKDYATSYIINEIDKEILSKEYETDDRAKDYAENQLKIIKLYYGNDDNQLLSALRGAGYNTIDEYKEVLIVNYKKQLATDDFAREKITDQEINKYYNDKVYGDVTISHILVKLELKSDATDEEKKAAEKKASDKINEIYEKLDSGKSFDEIAKEYSEDTATASKGGKLGTFTKGEITSQFNNDFENEVIKLKEKEYAKKAIKTSYGYHIIYKESQKDKPALETVKQTIIDNLIKDVESNDEKMQYKALIELRKKYGLEFNDEDIKEQYDTAVNNWLYGK